MCALKDRKRFECVRMKYRDLWKTVAAQHYQMRRIEIYLTFLRKDASIFDVGCADGVITMRLAKMGYNMTGLDPSRIRLKDGKMEARKEGLNIEFIRGDAENLPFKENSFDYVLSMQVLQFLPNPYKAIREFARVVNLGGMVIVDVPNRYCLYYFGLNRIVGFLKSRIPTFRWRSRTFSCFEMKAVFEQVGLTGIEIEYVLLVSYAFPDWLFKMLKPIEIFFEKSPFLRRFMGCMLCKGVVTKNKFAHAT